MQSPTSLISAGLPSTLTLQFPFCGTGGIQQAVPVAVDGSLHQRGAELRQIQLGRRQNFIAPREPLPVENGGADSHGAALVLVALDADVHRISGLHIPYRNHLGQADGLLVKLHAIDADVEIVPLGQIQVDAHKAVPVGGVGISHVRAGNTVGILAVAGGIAFRDVRTVAGDGQILALKLVPDLLVNARGSSEQVVLELERSAAGGKVQFPPAPAPSGSPAGRYAVLTSRDATPKRFTSSK